MSRHASPGCLSLSHPLYFLLPPLSAPRLRCLHALWLAFRGRGATLALVDQPALNAAATPRALAPTYLTLI